MCPGRVPRCWQGSGGALPWCGATGCCGRCWWCSGPINGLWIAAFSLALPLLIERAGITGPGGTGLGAYGLVISAYGCTNLLSTLAVGSRPIPSHPGRLMFAGTVVTGLGTAALALGAKAGLPALMAGPRHWPRSVAR